MLSRHSLKKAQKSFQVGIEDRARDMVMLQGACEFRNPCGRLTGFDHWGINKNHGISALLTNIQ
jgi:hypothetical protein